MKKLLVGLLACVLVWVVGSTGLKAAEPVKLTLFSYKAAEHEQKALKAVVESFEKANPDIKIELDLVSHGAGYDDIMAIRLASGEMSDLFGMTGGVYYKVAPENHLIDLSNEPWLKGFTPTVEKMMKVNGKAYAICTEIPAIGMFYKKDVLDANGLAVPKNWKEFVETCLALKQKGIKPLWMGNKTGIGGQFFSTPIAYSDLYKKYDADEFVAGINNGTKKFSEVYLKGFEMLAELIQKGIFDPKQANGMHIAENISIYAKEDYVFTIHGGWMKNDIVKANPNHTYLFGPIPVNTEGNPKAYIWAETYFGVYSGSKNQDAAKKFLAHFLKKDVMDAWVKALGAYSPLAGGSGPDDPVFAPMAQAVSAGDSDPFILPPGLLIGSEQETIVRPIAEEFFAGGMTPDAAVAKLDEQVARETELKKE
jgi:raffinose/stachyose/melibiose transport system substrate-binding protein